MNTSFIKVLQEFYPNAEFHERYIKPNDLTAGEIEHQGVTYRVKAISNDVVHYCSTKDDHAEKSDSIFEITRKHGEAMYIKGLEHSIATIEILGEGALEHLRAQLRVEQEKENSHSRFDAAHREKCNDCYQLYEDFLQESVTDIKEE